MIVFPELLVEIAALAGFAAALLFILGLKRMSSPVTARSGIVTAGVGMLVAVVAAFLVLGEIPPELLPRFELNILLALVALLLGTGWAWWSGKRVALTAMPQMVALYNGMGGGAAAAIAAVVLIDGPIPTRLILAATIVGALIGSISLSGSVIAWAKLDGRINGTWRFRGQSAFNGTVFLAACLLGLIVIAVPGLPAAPVLAVLFFVTALVFGVLMTLPIGGADMPVVISLYNAFTGLSVGLEGYAQQNPILMIAGMVVGSAGTLLTVLMAKAMNRSLFNVLFSNFGGRRRDGREPDRRQPEACRRRRRGHRHALCAVGGDRPGLRAGGRAGAAEALRASEAPAGGRRRGEVRGASGGRPHARAHERAAGRGRRAVRHHLRHG